MDITSIVLNEVLVKIGLEDLPNEKYAEYQKAMQPLVEQTVYNTIIETMTPEENQKLEERMAKGEEFSTLVSEILDDSKYQEAIAKAIEELIAKLGTIPE